MSGPDGTPGRSRIEDALDAARAGLDRVAPGDLAATVAAGALVVDIRPEADRSRHGALPGAVVVERIHLEWRLDPTSPWRIPEAGDPDRTVIVMCNDGYASSLAAVELRRIGVHGATDLDGGYNGLRDAGLVPER